MTRFYPSPTPAELAEQDQMLAMAKDAAETGMWVFVQNFADPSEVCWDCGRAATRQLHVFVPPPDRTEVIVPSCGANWVATVRAFGRPPNRLESAGVESAMWPLDVLPEREVTMSYSNRRRHKAAQRRKHPAESVNLDRVVARLDRATGRLLSVMSPAEAQAEVARSVARALRAYAPE